MMSQIHRSGAPRRPFTLLLAAFGAAVCLAGSASAAAPLPPILAPDLAAPPAIAAPPGDKPPPGTLEKVRAFGAIYVGYRESSIPFSYTDEEGKVYGYSWDLCQRVVDAVKARLNLPGLQVVPVLATPSTRLLMIETGMLDIDCGTVTNTDQRARYASFSDTYFVTGINGLVRQGSPIRAIADLNGKTVVTAAGTNADAYVKAMTTRRNILVNFRGARNHREAMNDLKNGKADIFVADDVLLQGLLADSSADAGNAAAAGAFRLALGNENFGLEPYGLMMRKGDPEFKKLVDEALVGLMKSGEFERIYARWFESPIPPKQINLKLPMGAELKQLIKTPNDRGI